MASADEKGIHHLPMLGSKPAQVQLDPINDLLPEDLVWADSCLNDPDASLIDWTSWDAFSHALNETMSSEAESLHAARTENYPIRADIALAFSSLQMESAEIPGTIADDDSFITEGSDENSEYPRIFTNIPYSDLILRNVLPPTWDDKVENLSTPPIEEVVDFPGLAMEQSTMEIFKVWDLNLPAEDDEFINQLSKDFAQGSLNSAPPSYSDDSRRLKGLEDAAIDDIISGMSDISLNSFYR